MCAKLLPMAVSIYPVVCVHSCRLLGTQHYCLCSNGSVCPPGACHPPTPTTHPTPLPPHPPPTRPPPINAIRDITGPVKKLSQKPALNTARQSYLWNSSYKSALLIQQIFRGYNAAQENHSGFNVSKRYFLKYKMWHYGRFSQVQSQLISLHCHICSRHALSMQLVVDDNS